MANPSPLTVGQVAELFGAPQWRVRRVVDTLSPEVARAGRYRLIPREALAEIAARLQRKNVKRQSGDNQKTGP